MFNAFQARLASAAFKPWDKALGPASPAFDAALRIILDNFSASHPILHHLLLVSLLFLRTNARGFRSDSGGCD